MIEKKNAMYVKPKSKDEIFVLWKTVAEWEEFIHQSAVNRHSIEKLETLEYITHDEDNKNEEYYQMDRELLIMILQHLEAAGKCTVSFIYFI